MYISLRVSIVFLFTPACKKKKINKKIVNAKRKSALSVRGVFLRVKCESTIFELHLMFFGLLWYSQGETYSAFAQ